ncbi:MAG: Holliday junction resolvase RuvX [Methylococcaceae bacterium]|mgnify:FL=1|jgi:putative Holliday junction resolvase|nr:Holliday junction resolvase RuvX [Methylococcaceae bacterium]
MVKHDPLAAKLSNHTYLGFDFGNKKIGIAVGQADTGIASPLTTLKSPNQVPDWNGIGKLISDWQPIALVVGLSLQADGSDNIVTPRMQKFCRQLNGRFNLPVHQIDESLTTFEAKQLLFDDLQVSAGKLWAVQDQLAAQLILQSWFNQQT